MSSIIGLRSVGSLLNVVVPLSLTSALGSYVVTNVVPGFWPVQSLIASFVWLYSVQFTLVFIYGVLIYPHLVSPLRHLPEPKDNAFLMGQFWNLLRKPDTELTSKWVNEIPNEGLVRFRMSFNSETVLVTNPAALKEVLVTKNYDWEKPGIARAILSVLLGNGILIAEGDEHKRQRKLLSPAFSFRHVKDLYPTFWGKAKQCTEAITTAINASQLPGKDSPQFQMINEWASLCTLDIIGIAGMGHDFNAILDPENELSRTYSAVFSQSGKTKVIVAILNRIKRTPLRYIIPTENVVSRAAKVVRRISQQLIEEKKVNIAKGGPTDLDILSIAMESGGFSDDNLADQLMTFLAAGHETTANALTLAVYSLCKKPELQSRLRDEIRSQLPPLSEDVGITSTQIDHLPYLNAICNETLRLLSPVPATGRISVRDTTILGTFIPKGTQIVIPSAAINQSKHLWGDDAAEFNPDRWMGPGRANTGGAESNYAFMSFIHGPRSCIGKDFSRAEFACVMAAWFGRFEMRFKDPAYKLIPASGSVVLRPRGGLGVKITQIDGW
ncbi:cytochrome P450 [Eremomyces bilateralis CBS 781.70]|uniref:Cytochrome P450 n=1 Tax=Eremomyces bilateralis CBS 781.70 TaxID=1392243 RepID=A0A6G1GE55_9PEZI|nr:cytochrome P450 [Eremomyces bilateralis CBS 781.70]KAF1816338.1 cytochrome P450 [Eremomyces bilateralis CBS 781.70]